MAGEVYWWTKISSMRVLHISLYLKIINLFVKDFILFFHVNNFRSLHLLMALNMGSGKKLRYILRLLTIKVCLSAQKCLYRSIGWILFSTRNEYQVLVIG